MAGHLEGKWRHRVKISEAVAFALAFCLIIGFSSICCSGMEIFKETDNGREITVRPGEVIRIELEQAGATGYVWEPHDLDTQYFEVLGTETRAAVKPEMTGLPVIKIWSIRALKEGKSELKFFYYRPWEGTKKAVGEFFLKVRILR